MDQKGSTDDGTIKTATLEQLQKALDLIPRMDAIFLEMYIRWVDGEHTWTYGNAYALDWDNWDALGG